MDIDDASGTGGPENTAHLMDQRSTEGPREIPGGRQIDLSCGPEYRRRGSKADVAKLMHGMGSGVFEIALPFRGDAFRVVYAVQLGDEIWAVHAFQRKSTQGIKTPKHELDLRGSGNVFRDLGHKNADCEQLKAILAADIIKALDRDGLSVRAAHARTGIAAADFSRIRNADLGRFTIDRLISILNRLGSRVEVQVTVRRATGAGRAATA